MILKLLLCWVGFFGFRVAGENVGPLVETRNGPLRGIYMTTKGGRVFSAFLAIPFAKPPVGELRFEPPVAYGKWKGTLNATKIHGICPQRDVYRRSKDIEGEEDCLYLNVYTPHNGNNDPLPVMVFFHGGGWLCGGGNSQWYGPGVLLDRDVLLVVTNYRLGALGFLSTGDSVVPGNNGLKDQSLALRWVRDNIDRFGGDPDKVTVFGESAGGASVHLHMLSPMSKGLFRAGIAQSGTALCIWAIAPKNEGVENSKKLARALGCPTEPSKVMVQCLRTHDPMEIIEKDSIFMSWDFDPMIPFKPTLEPDIEGAFLTEHPVDIIESGRSMQVPFIVGLTKEDGALRAAGILGNPFLFDALNHEFEKVVPISLMYDKTAQDVIGVSKKIKEFYFGDKAIDNSTAEELIAMYTDGWFLNCADETVRLHTKYTKTPVYYYLFGHRGVSSFTKIFGGGDTDYGVCHADELQYLFPIGDGLFPEDVPTEDDKYVTQLKTALWTNFAKTGNPTPETNEVITEVWKPVTTDDMEYFYIDAKSPGMRKGLYSERAKFWRALPSNPRGRPPKKEL